MRDEIWFVCVSCHRATTLPAGTLSPARCSCSPTSLSLHPLRLPGGYAVTRKHAQEDSVGDWRIDTSAGGPILVYQNCSVIESEQAEYVLRLIAADAEAKHAQEDAAQAVACSHCWGDKWIKDGSPCPACNRNGRSGHNIPALSPQAAPRVDDAMIGRALRAFGGTKDKTFTREKCEAMRRALRAAIDSEAK